MNRCSGLKPLKTILRELQNIQRGQLLPATCVPNATREKTGHVVGLSTKRGRRSDARVWTPLQELTCQLPPSRY